MKASFFLILAVLLITLPLSAIAQGNNNKKPKIVGQDELTTREDESITILMSHVDVEDPDDWFYPWGFTMTIYPGENYALQGSIVIPAENFYGELKVPVTVHDGQDESNKHDLIITVTPVNDKPVITGHTSVSTNENEPVVIELSHLKVVDPDNQFPNDFTLRLYGGSNYAVQGNTVVPQNGFSGTLMVNVRVHDGQLESDSYALPLTVKKINRVPQITGQSTLQVNEDESIVIAFSHLTVVDEDNNYPDGFSMTLQPGANYSFSGTTVTPLPDFFGKILVPVIVSDGVNSSTPFNLSIAVTPVNDLPAIVDLESEPLLFGSTDISVEVSDAVNVVDVDGDSIMFAEIGIRQENYQPTTDKLVYTAEENSNIRGVFDANTGVLTLLGQSSPARYARAIRNVQYQSLAPAPGQSKILFFMVNDGKSDSEVLERPVLIGQASVSLDIPTAFTPNGDLSNDTWKIVPLKSEEAYASARIKVYNKAGSLVYESVGFESEWDGRLNGEQLPADTYFYTIDLNINAPEGYLKGLVTILR